MPKAHYSSENVHGFIYTQSRISNTMAYIQRDTMQKSPRSTKSKSNLIVPKPETSHTAIVDSDIISINVSGKVFQTYKSTLKKREGTLLSNLGFSHVSYQWHKNEYFFDRHSGAFEAVLEYLRTGSLHMPKTICSNKFSEELRFWGVNEADISDCCWHTFCKGKEEEETFAYLKKTFTDNGPLNVTSRKPAERLSMSERIWLFLENPMTSRPARIWAVFNTLVIIISTLTHALFSLEELREKNPQFDNPKFQNITNSKLRMMLVTNPRKEILIAEIAFLVFITIDVLLRFLTCPSKWWTIKSLVFWVDIFYIVPGWLVAGPYYWHPHFWKQEGRQVQLITLHTLMVVRIFRLYSVTRYYRGLRSVFIAIRASAKEMFLLFAFVLIAMVIYGSLIFMAEFYVPDRFHNTFYGYWWAIVTMSTVGYGDMFPVSIPGYFVGAMCTLTGLVFLGLPIAIITNKFNAFYSYRQRNHFNTNSHSVTVAPLNKI